MTRLDPSIPISVLLPVRNRLIGSFTIQFLQGQLSESDELIISFNNSRQDIIDGVLEQTKQLNASVRVLQQKKTKPIYAHWKILIDSADHDVVLFVHDDDVYHGDIVNLVRSTFANDADTSFVTSQIVIINLSKTPDIRLDGSKTEILAYNWDAFFAEKQHSHFIAQFNTSFYAFRRSKIGDLQFLDKNPPNSDFILFYAGLLSGTVYILPQYLAARLQHGSNSVLHEYSRANHATGVLRQKFAQFNALDLRTSEIFLAHHDEETFRHYNNAWKSGLLSGMDPKKLVIIFRRLKKIRPSENLQKKYYLLKLLMATRRFGLWKIQNYFFIKTLNIYRLLRGPSRFYKQFPAISLPQLATVMIQPLHLLESYLALAYKELGVKR